MNNNGEPDITRLLGGGPAAEDLTGEPRRRRRAKKGVDITPIPDSEIRLRILNRLSEMHQQAFDEWTAQLIEAMVLVMDMHRPWRREIQVFESNQHAGEQQVIAGCRSCSWSYRQDCPTVMSIAHKLRLSQF